MPLPGAGMFGIFSDVKLAQEKFARRANKVPDAIDKAVGINAKIALRESVVQIDELIYTQSQDPASTYLRTKNLRRSNKIEKLGWASWMVYNDADYAGFVHDGTSVMYPRPWMQNALDLKAGEMMDTLVKVGELVMEGTEVTDLRLDPGGTTDPGATGG